MQKAWFLDRDGTIIEDKHYLGDPDGVVLLPNAVKALKAAQDVGFLLIVVTNQSGIARGYFTEADADKVDQRLAELLAAEGVTITKSYRCPHLPDGQPPYNVECDCRKPGVGLFRRAIEEFDLDPAQCIACGDKLRDIQNLSKLGIPEENTGIVGTENIPDLTAFLNIVGI